MSDSHDPDDPRMNRRAFGLSAFSAGLTLLATPAALQAQEAKQRKQMKKMHPASMGQGVEPPRNVDLDALSLVATIWSKGRLLGIDLHLLNRSREAVHAPHDFGGMVSFIPTGQLVIGKKTYPVEARIPQEEMGMISRAARITYLTIAPSGQEGRATFYARYEAEWPDTILKNIKDFAGLSAAAELTLTIERSDRITRSGKSTHALTALSNAIRVPDHVPAA